MTWVASNFTTTVSNDAIDQRSCAMMFLQKIFTIIKTTGESSIILSREMLKFLSQ
jgi:hypothetical protein